MSIDLTTDFGGLRLKSPIIVGACPLTAQEQSRRGFELAGAGAVVLPSLFEEQVVAWNLLQGNSLTGHEERLRGRSARLQVSPPCDSADNYLATVRVASAQSSVPVIASLNGESGGNWLGIALALQEAGAAAIELHVRHAPPSEYSGPREMEDRVVELASMLRRVIQIPLLLKLGHSYTSLAHLACRLLSGASGLVLYGRAPYVDIGLDDLQLKTEWGLTHPGSIASSLGSIMQIHAFCPAMPLAACGGIGSPADLIKALLAGADVAVVASAVYRDGPDAVRRFIDGLIVFMERHHLTSLQDLQTHRPLAFGSEEERCDYIKALSSRFEARQIRASEALDGGDPEHEETTGGDRWGHHIGPE